MLLRASRDILASSSGLYFFDKGVCGELLLVAEVGCTALALLRRKYRCPCVEPTEDRFLRAVWRSDPIPRAPEMLSLILKMSEKKRDQKWSIMALTGAEAFGQALIRIERGARDVSRVHRSGTSFKRKPWC